MECTRRAKQKVWLKSNVWHSQVIHQEQESLMSQMFPLDHAMATACCFFKKWLILTYILGRVDANEYDLNPTAVFWLLKFHCQLSFPSSYIHYYLNFGQAASDLQNWECFWKMYRNVPTKGSSRNRLLDIILGRKSSGCTYRNEWNVHRWFSWAHAAFSLSMANLLLVYSGWECKTSKDCGSMALPKSVFWIWNN